MNLVQSLYGRRQLSLKPQIATVINFCTNEARFIKASIQECRRFSKQIIVAVCDHFFDGTSEDRALLDGVYAAFPDCLFVEYPFFPQAVPPKRSFSHFWHNASRLAGASCLRSEIDWVFFLDADEVPDGGKVLDWIHTADWASYSAFKLSCYWYFREPVFRARQKEDTILLVRKDELGRKAMLHDDERDGIYAQASGQKLRRVSGSDGSPMFHHYSWVRTKDEMLKKVRSWGHSKDRNWEALVEEEFSREFSGIDFVHGYQFSSCEPLFGVSLAPPAFEPSPQGEPQVKKLSPKELMQCVYSGFWARMLRKFFNLRG